MLPIGATARGTERWPYFEMKDRSKVTAKQNPPMKNNNDSFFVEALDSRQEARALTLEAICRMLIWMADEPSIEDRGLRTSVALYCIRPDLIDGETLARIGDGSGRTRQHIPVKKLEICRVGRSEGVGRLSRGSQR